MPSKKHQKLHDKIAGKSKKFTALKNKGEKIKSKNASTNPLRKLPDHLEPGQKSHFRTKQTINRLNMYKEKIDWEKRKERPDKPARIEPDRKWFGNVRTIDQKQLEKFRVDLAQHQSKPNQFLIAAKKLPTSLLVEPTQKTKVNLLEIERFEDTFGLKKTRKKPKLETYSYEQMMSNIEEKDEKYNVDKDKNIKRDEDDEREIQKDKRLEAGQSKRIWEELYKVLDASDVICQVIDVRDPYGTRSAHIERHLKKNGPHKHLVLILNKVDLVPTEITKKWVETLKQEYPTIPFHASVTNPFGKGALLNTLRQFDNFHKDKQNISIGFIGYPNVGKSSVINSLKSKKVCKAAPVPGETRVWQYITLTKRIYLIDCPGIVYNYEGIDDVQCVLKGVVRAERLKDPCFYVNEILKLISPKVLEQIYGLKPWEDDEDFLEQLARKKGKLLKGGQPDLSTTAKLVLIDWQRSKIPYFKLPPNFKTNNKIEQEQEGEKPSTEETTTEQVISTVTVGNDTIINDKDELQKDKQLLKKSKKQKEENQ